MQSLGPRSQMVDEVTRRSRSVSNPQVRARPDLVLHSALAARPSAPDIVPWEAGSGRNARQPGQVRKEAAVTSLSFGSFASLLPIFRKSPESHADRHGREPGTEFGT